MQTRLGLSRWCSRKESACQCGRGNRRGLSPRAGKIPWRRKWQCTPAFLPGEFYGQRSLEGCSPRGHKESDTTELLRLQAQSSKRFRIAVVSWVCSPKWCWSSNVKWECELIWKWGLLWWWVKMGSFGWASVFTKMGKFWLKYSWHTVLHSRQGHCTIIWHLNTIWSDHHDNSDSHLSPCKFDTVLLAMFLMLYVTPLWLIHFITGGLHLLIQIKGNLATKTDRHTGRMLATWRWRQRSEWCPYRSWNVRDL